MSSVASPNQIVDRVTLQNQLFGKLSEMFAAEVPLYDKSLVVNQVCNRAICDLFTLLYPDFQIDDAAIVETSGERHGAIRIGRRDEYRWSRTTITTCPASGPKVSRLLPPRFGRVLIQNIASSVHCCLPIFLMRGPAPESKI